MWNWYGVSKIAHSILVNTDTASCCMKCITSVSIVVRWPWHFICPYVSIWPMFTFEWIFEWNFFHLLLQIPLPDQPPWFLLFGASEEDLKDICKRILRLYSLPSPSFSSLLHRVDQCRQALDANAAKAKLGEGALLALGTPTRDPPSNFSPASKAGNT